MYAMHTVALWSLGCVCTHTCVHTYTHSLFLLASTLDMQNCWGEEGFVGVGRGMAGRGTPVEVYNARNGKVCLTNGK